MFPERNRSSEEADTSKCEGNLLSIFDFRMKNRIPDKEKRNEEAEDIRIEELSRRSGWACEVRSSSRASRYSSAANSAIKSVQDLIHHEGLV